MTRDVVVPNALGLHARAAARFVQTAARFAAQIRVSRGGRTVDGKSLMGVLLLAASQGSTLQIDAEGPDAEAALDALAALVACRLRGGCVMRRLSGAGVVGGIASGQAVLLVRRGRALRVPVADARIGDEVSRLERARERSRQQIAAIRARLSTGPGAELAPLFDAQLLMLDDPLLVGRARALIGEEKVNAEWAVQRAFDEVAALFDDIDDPYLRDRRGDVADVAGRVRMNLRDGTRGWQDVLDRGDGPFVLVADDPPPSVAAQVDWSRVTGLAIDAGSRTSHTAILARSLGIPTVVGLGEATLHVRPGMPVIVDGTRGELIVEPSAAVAEELRARANRQPAAGARRRRRADRR